MGDRLLPGDRVRHRWGKNKKFFFEATVTQVIPHNPDNPLVEHGSISVSITNTNNPQYKIGDTEHFCESNWVSILKKL